MADNDPQQAEPGATPDTVVSQQTAAAVAGPDSMKLPPNPLHSERGQGSGERDWEASYKGLNRTLQEKTQKWEEERREYQQRFEALEGKMKSLTPQAPEKKPQAPAPVSDGKTEGANQDSELYELLAQRDAERHKWKLLAEYTEPGKPGHGLPLLSLADNVQTFAPDLTDDGSVDDSAQRKEIEKIIGAFKGVQGNTVQQTQEALTSGWTPGSSPGTPPPPDSKEALLQEYYRLKEAYGNMDDSTSSSDQARIQARYYELHEQIGKFLPGQTKPWMSSEELLNYMQQIEGRMGNLEGMFKRK
jgi:hypothetical protein